MSKTLFRSLLMRANKMLQPVQMRSQRSMDLYGVKECEINLQIEGNWLFSWGLGRELNLHRKKFICMSINKNYLHCYHLSTIYGVVK